MCLFFRVVLKEVIEDAIHLVRVEWRQIDGVRLGNGEHLDEFLGNRRYAGFVLTADSSGRFDYVDDVRGEIVWLYYNASCNPWSEQRLKLNWQQFQLLGRPFLLGRKGVITYSSVDED